MKTLPWSPTRKWADPLLCTEPLTINSHCLNWPWNDEGIFMQIAEFKALLAGSNTQAGFTMSQEQMVLLPFVDRAHDRTRFAVAFAGTVHARDGRHTINLTVTYLAGEPHFFMACGSPYLEGLEVGVRFKRAKAAVYSICVTPKNSFESDTQVHYGIADHWGVLSRIERTEPQLQGLITQNYDTYPASARCDYTGNGFSSKDPCDHIAHALARMRLSGEDFISHMQERFIALHKYYTGESPAHRPLLVNGAFVIDRYRDAG